MLHKDNIAIIYFSRSARQESRRKSWLSGALRARNEALASCLITHSAQSLRSSGLPVFHFHEGNQRGDSFGARLANAYADVFAQGYQAVVSVGNDCPDLDRIDWSSVCASLQRGQAVIGPSLRGGAYLIGITAVGFRQKEFEALPWQRRELLSALHSFCASSGDYLVLRRRRDINTYDDLRLLLRDRELCGDLLRQLRRLLHRRKGYYRALSISIKAYHVPCGLRAPPLYYPA